MLLLVDYFIADGRIGGLLVLSNLVLRHIPFGFPWLFIEVAEAYNK